eukprot:COSAG06_NODE_3593_length_5143_cov_2.358247_3_plen_123_part_00
MIAAGVGWQQGARRPLTHEQRQWLRHPNRAAPAPTNNASSYWLTYPPHDSFAYTDNISAAACGAECTKRNCSCYDWIGTHTHTHADGVATRFVVLIAIGGLVIVRLKLLEPTHPGCPTDADT